LSSRFICRKYEFIEDFEDMSNIPVKFEGQTLKASWFDTELGQILSVADDESLYLLEFVERRGLGQEVERVSKKFKTIVALGETKITIQVKSELEQYFKGKLNQFKTPLHIIGSPFQQSVWRALQQIPIGETKSYLELAGMIKHPKSFRAVANANGANQFVIVIPCHRVINHNGNIGGYGGGISRKQWLLNHERKILGKEQLF
jgi:AraC family transcriptional regulator of adaptative response/methylated-DNA-[protein]-cysteine methyltransferase